MRVLQVGDAVEKVLGARRQRERKRQRACRSDGRAHALERLVERIDRRRGASGCVLDRAADEPRRGRERDRCGTRLRVVGEAVFQVRADGQRRRIDDRPRIGERLVAREGTFAVRPAERERESGARRRQRFETQRGQHLRGPRVPRIGDREYRRPPVQRGKGFATDRLRAHPAILRRATLFHGVTLQHGDPHKSATKGVTSARAGNGRSRPLRRDVRRYPHALLPPRLQRVGDRRRHPCSGLPHRPAKAAERRTCEFVERDQRFIAQEFQPQLQIVRRRAERGFLREPVLRFQGSDSAWPDAIRPLGGTPSRTKNAREPGSIERVRPHAQRMSTCPCDWMLRRLRGSSGQFQRRGFRRTRKSSSDSLRFRGFSAARGRAITRQAVVGSARSHARTRCRSAASQHRSSRC